MSSIRIFVTVNSKKYPVILSSLTLENLEKQIVEVNKEDQQGNTLVKIVNSDHSIETDQQLQKAIEDGQLDFNAYFYPKIPIEELTKQNGIVEEKEQTLAYKIKYPLVLLTGAIKYEHQPYSEDAKQNLHLLQTLFETKFGYQVFSTYNLTNPTTESLILNALENFILNNCLHLSDSSKNVSYDGLIFVWCGYGERYNGNILITSDNKRKDFKDIQHTFVKQTDYFVGKPKLFINVICGGDGINQNEGIQGNEIASKRVWYHQDIDLFSIISNTSRKTIIDNSNENPIERRGSQFTSIFCQMLQNSLNKSLECIIEQVNEILLDQVPGREVVQAVSTAYSDLYLIPHSRDDDNKQGVLESTNHSAIESLDFKRHWNRYWRNANVEAAEAVEEMLHKNEQGVVVVASNASEWKSKDDNPSSFTTLVQKDNVNKKKIQTYEVYVIKSECIIFDEVNIDGNVYVINCKIQCQANITITTQLFVTKDSTVEQKLKQPLPLIQWNTKIHHDIPIQLQDFHEKKDKCSERKLFDDAILHLQKYLQLCVDTFGCNHSYVAISYNLIGNTYFEKSEYNEAIEYYQKALKIISEIHCPFVAQLYHNLGDSFNHSKQYNKAIECFEDALKIRIKLHGSNHDDVGDLYSNLGNVYYSKGKYEESIECHERALKIRLQICGGMDSDVAHTYSDLGFAYENIELHDKAIECYENALKIKKELYGSINEDFADLCWISGYSCEKGGKILLAVKYYEEAWKVYNIVFGEWNYQTTQAKESLRGLI
ncbi:hypothetical protein RFI_14710 [Reticulomyxa filosa]|uniref:Peptidase C14 caspase domain-containing protein n=1 Tax=Reticulomyxa filosa TaxID=46433 RepID=X6N9A4_RETFI|nr:hypothetical protein RFI_14710 [Reticulomyxa filosa]|eukprot:ETO22488.1 hypothetical protein RFI_14710 [Reticulomyxa filosa]